MACTYPLQFNVNSTEQSENAHLTSVRYKHTALSYKTLAEMQSYRIQMHSLRIYTSARTRCLHVVATSLLQTKINNTTDKNQYQ